MMISQLARRLSIYLAIFLVFLVISHLLLKLYYIRNYSAENAEKLLSSVSSYKFFSDDPCATSIVGDPIDAGLQYVKINLHCDRSSTITNTLDLRAVKQPTYRGLIQLLGNINGFRVQISDSEIDSLGGLKKSEGMRWRCFTDHQHEVEITNFNLALKEQQTVDCFYNFDDSAVNQYYDNH